MAKYKNSMIIVGGEQHTGEKANSVDCLSDIRQYFFEKNEWKRVKCGGDYLEPRKKHAGVVLGKSLLVHGGVNSFEKYLKDWMLLSLETFSWTELEIDQESKALFIDGLAWHSMTAIVSRSGKFSGIYGEHSEGQGTKLHFRSENRIKEEGVYIFGGINGEHELNPDLCILKIGTKPVRIIKPKANGQAPCPRCGHSAIYWEKLNALIIAGGINDELFSTKGTSCLDDIWALDVETITWTRVKITGAPFKSRHSHGMVGYDSQLVFFGGISEGRFVGAEIDVLETSQSEAKRLEFQEGNNEALKKIESIPERNKFTGKSEPSSPPMVSMRYRETTKKIISVLKKKNINLKGPFISFRPYPGVPTK